MVRNKTICNKLNAAVFAALVASAAGAAQAATAEWKFDVAPSLWLPDMHGSIAANGQNGRVSTELSDTVSGFDAGVLFHAEAVSPHHDVDLVVDSSWLDLSSDRWAPIGRVESATKYQQVDLKAVFRINSNFDLLAGARYNAADFAITTNGFRNSDSREWFDPIGGARFHMPINREWTFRAYGDVGGFDIGNGSDLAWSLQAGVDYQFAENASVGFGYRLQDVDYSAGNSFNRTTLDARSQGPLVGINVHF